MEQEYPTLARLSFCIAPDRQQAFQEAYAQQLCPILARYGLVADNAKPQDSGEGVLSYFFTVPSPGAVIEYEERLNQDSQWIQAIRQMGIAFVEDRGSYLKIFHHFGAYSGSLGQPTVRSVDVDARVGLHFEILMEISGLGLDSGRVDCADMMVTASLLFIYMMAFPATI